MEDSTGCQLSSDPRPSKHAPPTHLTKPIDWHYLIHLPTIQQFQGFEQEPLDRVTTKLVVEPQYTFDKDVIISLLRARIVVPGYSVPFLAKWQNSIPLEVTNHSGRLLHSPVHPKRTLKPLSLL